MSLTELPLSKLRVDGGTQPRTALSDATVAEYADAYKAGGELPPPVAFHDGSDYWLGDGFHRAKAADKAGFTKLAVDVRAGTRRDAILYSVGANATHGLPRSNADKRQAVETLLRDAEWGKWSDNRIATQCAVSHPFVAKVRRDVFPPPEDGASCNGFKMRKAERGGKTHDVDTSNIGKGGGKRKSSPAPEPTPAPETPAADAANHDDTPAAPTPEPAPLPEWQQVAADVDGIIADLEGVARRMRAAFEIKGQEINRDAARRYTWSGTVGAVNALVRYLEADKPVGADAKGILTASDVAKRNALGRKSA